MAGDLDQDGQIGGRRSLYVEQDQRQTWLTTGEAQTRKRCPNAPCNISNTQTPVYLFFLTSRYCFTSNYTFSLSQPFWHGCSTQTLNFHIIHTASRLLCLSAFTWIDIANSELWPTTVSLLPDDHALQQGHRLPLWVLHLFSTQPTGPLRLLHPIDRLFSNWT